MRGEELERLGLIPQLDLVHVLLRPQVQHESSERRPICPRKGTPKANEGNRR
jgi:hypothetical protein